MASEKSKKLAGRLAGILVLFYSGKSYSATELSEKYDVSVRTINNDIDRLREAGLDIDNCGNRYSLDKSSLGELNIEDIEVFAEVMGLEGMYPELSRKLLNSLIHSENSIYRVIGHEYEDLDSLKRIFKDLEIFICKSQKIRFIYKGKKYSNVKPYKLINQNGIWYLAAQTEDEKLKSFHVGSLKSVVPNMNGKFIPDPEIIKIIDDSDSIWFEEDLETITLDVSANVSSYFKRRPLLPNQKLVDENEDGSIILECRTGNIKDFIPRILYWIPDVRIVSPDYLKKVLVEKIELYK